MGKSLLTRALAFFLVFAFSTQVFAQADDKSAASAFEAREAIGAIMLSGLVGGILGLSTLSFYTEPQDHIRNITLGAGVGMLFAVIYLTSNAAVAPVKVDEKGNATAYIFPVVDERSVKLGAILRF